MAHLARVGEVSDHNGKASTMLAATIGYPGSSVAFAQLLTGMERAGLIQREIRGKRTYRIIPGPAAPPPGALPPGALAPEALAPDALAQPAPAPDGGTWTAPAAGGVSRPARERARGVAAAAPPVPEPAATGQRAAAPTAEAPETGAAAGTGPAGLNLPAGPDGLDYDELARRLLVQVVRRLAGPDAGRAPETALQETVASLEQKLASATSRQRRLAEENTRLREQLRAAEQGLAEAQDRATAEALAARFDSAEVLLLERLLSPLREQRRQSPEADTG
jgi:hypothetical protein